jgi:hypothetical protein
MQPPLRWYFYMLDVWLEVVIIYALRIKLNGQVLIKSKLSREWTKQ